MFGWTEDISIIKPSIHDHWIAHLGGRWDRKKGTALGSGANPIVMRDEIFVDRLFWESGISIAKLNRDTEYFSGRLSVIIDLDLKSAGNLKPLNGMSGWSSNNLGRPLAKPAARNIGALNPVGVAQLAFVDVANSKSEISNGHGTKSRHPIMANSFEYGGRVFNQEDMERGALIAIAIIFGIYYAQRGV